MRQRVRTEVLQRHMSLRTSCPKATTKSRRGVSFVKVDRQDMVVQISWVLGAERVRALTAIPLAFIPVLIRKLDLFPRNTPNDELLRRSREKESLGRGVDDVDILDHVCGGKKRARFHEGCESRVVQLEELDLSQLAFGVQYKHRFHPVHKNAIINKTSQATTKTRVWEGENRTHHS